MALNFPDSPVDEETYTDPNGIIYTYNATKGYWSTSNIDASLSNTPNDSSITLSAGTGLSGGGTFTTNQLSGETITFAVDLNELSISTTDGDGDYFVVVDTAGNERKLTKSSVNISGFNNDAGFITSADGGNAATIDGIDSSEFLRSDVSDTATGLLNFNGNIRINSQLLDTSGAAGTSGRILSSTGSGVDWINRGEEEVGTISSSSLDLSTGAVFSDTPSSNITYTFINPPPSGIAYGFTLKITPSASITITWPTSVNWPGGAAPDAPASGETDIFTFYTQDGGTTYFGFQAGDASA